MANPQTQDVSNPEEIYAVNAKWVNGAAPGYWPTAGSGLTLNLSAGTSFARNVRASYAGGTLSLTNNATNYVFLDTTASNAPTFNTSGYPQTGLPIATVVTASGAITTITDDRVFGLSGGFATATLAGIVPTPPNDATKYLDGTANWSAPPTSFTGLSEVAGITIDGGASTPATGSKGYLQVPFGCTITGWTLLADASGSAQITVKKCSDAGFPTTSSIVASAPPLISSAQKGESSTLTGWTTAITALDILEFNLDSVTTCKRLTLELKLTRT